MFFSIGNALNQGFKIWARNFVPFTLLGLLVYAPVFIWLLVTFKPGLTDGEATIAGLMVGALPMLLNLFIAGVVTYGVVMEMRGQHVSMGTCIGVGLTRFLPALGVGLLSMLAVIGGFMLLFIPGIIAFCMLYVATQASVMEKPGLFGALRRSRHLTAGNKLNVFGLLVIFGLVTGVPRKIFEMIILPDPEHPSSFAALQQYVYMSLGFSVVVGTLGAVVAAVTYFQLRQEKDGVSIDEIARVFD